MIIPPSVPVGITPGDHDPIYVNLQSPDRGQQIVNTTMQQGHVQNRGVILTDDTDKIPLPFLFWINDNKTEISRPVASLLFRHIATKGDSEIPSEKELYEMLRNDVPNELKTKLENNEKLFFSQQDPDLIAYDQSLKFAASMLATLFSLGGPPISTERANVGVINFAALPMEVRTNLTAFCSEIRDALNAYLKEVGPNQPAFDIYLKAFNSINEVLTIL